MVSWQVLRNLSYLCTFHIKCLFIWSSKSFIHQWRYPEGAERKKEDGCQPFNFTPLLTFQNFFLYKTSEWIHVQTVEQNSIHQFSLRCQAKAREDGEHDISIYWKEQEMEEKAIDWKMSESDCVIVNWSTTLQGDSRLAAAPFAPGALLVSDSDLDQILHTVEQTALVYEFSRFNLPMQDLVPYVPNTLFTYMNKACFWQQHHNWLIGFQLILESTVLTGLCIHWLLSTVFTRTSRFMRQGCIQACWEDKFHLRLRQP